MKSCFIILAAFSICSGCFCNVNSKKEFTEATVRNNSNITNVVTLEGTTSFHTTEINTKLLKTPNNDAINRSKIIVNDLTEVEEQRLFSKWKFNILGKLKLFLVNFFDKLEQEQADLIGIDNDEYDYLTNPKRRGIDEFLKKAADVLAETKRKANNIAKSMEDQVQKMANIRNISDVADEENLISAVPLVLHPSTNPQDYKGVIQDFQNSTAIITFKEDLHEETNLGVNKDIKINSTESSNNISDSVVTEGNQLVKEEEKTKIFATLGVQFVTDTNTIQKNRSKENKGADNVLENTTKTVPRHIKFIDKNTEYFFGEGSTEQTNTHQVRNKNLTTEENTGTEDENSESYSAVNTTHSNKCKGNLCNAHNRKRRANHTHSQKGRKKKEIFQKTLPSTLRNFSNKADPQNTSVYTKNSFKNANQLAVAAGAVVPSNDSVSHKDGLWQHLQAVGSNSSKSKENFLKTHHFLFNSGGTEKSTTVASEVLLTTLSYENVSNKTDSMINLDRIILENENSHQNPNVVKELPLKRHRRVKRYTDKRNAKKIVETEKDAEVILPDEEEYTTSTINTDTSTASTEEIPTTDTVKITSSIPENQSAPTTTDNRFLSTATKKVDEARRKHDGETETMPINNKILFELATEHYITTRSDESEIKITVPKTSTPGYKNVVPKMRGQFEREWNDGGGIRTKPLLVLVTLPSFIGMGMFILVLCFLTRNGGWCCRLFNPRSISQTSVTRDVQEPLVTNRKYYK